MILIAPSLLAADFCNLNKQIIEVEQGGADWLHIDIMDGHFVPIITFGPLIVNTVRQCTDLPLDVHLMVEKPESMIEEFYNSGARIITVHQETCSHLYRTIHFIKDLGAKAGVALNPSTPISFLKEVIYDVDLVLIMTVEPGFGGQKFITSTLDKIKEAKDLAKHLPNKIFIEVDGGIDQNTAASVLNAGANVLVAGTSIFKSRSIQNTISKLRTANSNNK
jgi:ribulose-phosphate 3-epimerase